MKIKLRFYLILQILALMLSGCNKISDAGTEKILSNENISKKETALNSYSAAKIQSLKWKETAELYQIPINSIMASNLGIPQSPDAWYFMFKDSMSPLELFIEVINGNVTGYTEAQPIITDSNFINTEIIGSIDGLIDSDEAIKIMLNNSDQELLNTFENVELSLVKFKSHKNPVWTIFSKSQDSTSPTAVFQIDAKSGEQIVDIIE